MYNAFQFLANVLTNTSGITDQVAAAKIYPVVASGEVEAEFLTYRVGREGIATKEQIAEYRGVLHLFSETIETAIQKADVIEAELIATKKIRSRGASVAYAEDYQRAYVELIITFKI